MTPNTQFNELIKDINPSSTTISRSSAAHTAVRDAIWADDDYKGNLIIDFLGGSYKRQTSIRPQIKNGDTERPDVDIYVVVKGAPWTAEPSELIDDLYGALNRARSALNITSITRNRCSIAISTNKADMDVSPLLDRQSDGLYRIGNTKTGEWFKTDPVEHSAWSSRQNETFAGRFKPTVKMVKWARRVNPTKHRHPKSFSLEAIVAQHMPSGETHYGQIIHDTFDSFVDAYSVSRLLEQCPDIADPGVVGGNLLDGVSGQAFCAYYDKIESHRNDAAKALDTDDQDKATTYWRRIFGDRFPAAKSASAGLQSAVSVSPLTFPDAAAAPARRPAKFA